MSALILAGAHDDALRALLREDLPHGDLSTRALGLGARPATIGFAARARMTVAGLEAAARLLQLCGVEVQRAVASGDAVDAGAILLHGEGPAEAVLAGWKTAQTLVEACSGIASEAAAIVGALRGLGHATPVACTRKNFPGTRWLAADAVRAGGAVMHRLGLSETLLVFPEHRALMDPADWAARLAALKAQQPEKRLVVEVGHPDDAMAAARLGVDVLQLERHSPAQVVELRTRLREAGLAQVRLAPAGGVNRHNAVDYARAGADLLVTSAPYFAPPADVKVTIAPAGAAAH